MDEPQDASDHGGTDGLAVASLVLGIVWLLGVGSIAAVVLGHRSRARAARQGRPSSGLALAGLVLGYVGLVGLVPVIAAVAVPVAAQHDQRAREAVVAADLRAAAVDEEALRLSNDTYLDVPELVRQGLVLHKGVDLRMVSRSADRFCLSATLRGVTSYYDSAAVRVQAQPCR